MDNPAPPTPAADAARTADDWISSGWQNYVFKKFREAEDDFRRAVQLDDGSADAHYGLGLSLHAQQRIPAAIAALDAAQQRLKQSDAHADAGHYAILSQLIQVQRDLFSAAPLEEA